jgi:TIR domain
VSDKVKVFVSYSHTDAQYLENDSLLGFLKGLEREGVGFWTDRQIKTGELWDDIIKANLQQSDIALVLVSQAFLDSEYCQNVEIKGFLAGKAHLFPVILSPCDWRRHEWLAKRQFLPGGDKTVEEHYQDSGSRKRLFLEIREQLREHVAQRRKEAPPPGSGDSSSVPSGSGADPPYGGKAKIAFCERLGDDWKRLADQLQIRPSDQARFERGDEGRGIWVWLENRGRLTDLPKALAAIDRADLAQLLGQS